MKRSIDWEMKKHNISIPDEKQDRKKLSLTSYSGKKKQMQES